MSNDSLPYDELKAKHDELQRRAAHALVLGQDLINAKDRIDRELSRFRAIQSYSERVIKVQDISEFNQITVEAIIETFEFECSALLSLNDSGTSLNVKAAFGFDELVGCCTLSTEWLDKTGHLKGRNAFIEDLYLESHPWAELRLCQVILCPFFDSDSELKGFVLGGRTEANKVFYDEITREVFPSFRVFSQHFSNLLQNFESKKYLEKTVGERTEELRAANTNLISINEDLEEEISARKKTEFRLRVAENEAKELSEFLKKTFGRYMSKQVMDSLLENPAALELGGELRCVSLLSTDIRGFTPLSGKLGPEQIVTWLNTYFEVMMELINEYQGTINDVVGDALLVFFGAPQQLPDRTERAVACAIAMQNAMGGVNAANRSAGLPEIGMGIGLHNAEVVVGNIGSKYRTKYSVVGSGVNLVTRIESYTVGGQILASPTIYKEVGHLLRIDGQQEIYPKGFALPLTIFEVGGIAGKYNLVLEIGETKLFNLTKNVPFQYTVVKGKHIGQTGQTGSINRLSRKEAEIVLQTPIELFSDLKMNLSGVYEELTCKDFYGKVTKVNESDPNGYRLRFTSMPLEVVSYFLGHMKHAHMGKEKGKE